MAKMNEAVRKAVKDAMKAKGVTQEQMASAIGLHRVQVNRLLNGRSNDTPDSWQKILDLVDLDIAPVPKK